MYAIFAGLFFFGGLILKKNFDEETQTYSINPD